MPILEDEGPTEPRLGVHPSVPVELDWALSGVHRLGQRRLRPVLEELYAGDPDLVNRVATLWGPGETLSYTGYLELSILAHDGGLLFSFQTTAFVDALDELCRRAPSDLRLAAETPEDRAILLHRLDLLRTSAKRRKQYVGMVREIWDALRPGWEAEGRPAVQAAIAFREAEISRRPTWEDLARNTCKSPEALAELIRPLGPAEEVAVVPAWFGHGRLIMDLPGLVVVGVDTESGDGGDRHRSDELARRLKAIADPTRLAILETLGRHEMTVTDIARRFGLSQPTVSNHIKLLREAGFVQSMGDGRSRNLVVRREVVDSLGSDLQGLLGAPPA